MKLPRIFHDCTLQSDARITLAKPASHHLCTVLRLSPNDNLILFNGDGNDYHATLLVAGKQAQVHIGNVIQNRMESPLAIHLLQGISRGDRMDTTIQKAVELGVKAITPLLTEKGQIKLDGDRLEKKCQHWQKIVIGACEQCGRSVVPSVHPPLRLSSYLAQSSAHNKDARIVLDPMGINRIGNATIGSKHCQLLVGPESGLSQDELELLTTSGFQALSLGPRILRTETAGPAAMAILQARFGDLSA